LKPLSPFEVRDLNREVEERLSKLRPLQNLVVVKSFDRKNKCYGIGYNKGGDLILRNFGCLLRTHFKPYSSPTIYVTVYNMAGTPKTIRTMSSDSIIFQYRSYDVSGVELGFGNPASTPTPARTDYNIDTPVAWFNPSSSTLDETLWKVIVTGSYVWVAGGTVKCAGLRITGTDGTGVAVTFLMYYDAVSDVVVPADGTVSVTYFTQI